MIKRFVLWACCFFVAANIDITLGVVLDESGNGRVLNNEPVYNYIHYDMDRLQVNQLVLTICIMNPANLEPDDVLLRIDI